MKLNKQQEKLIDLSFLSDIKQAQVIQTCDKIIEDLTSNHSSIRQCSDNIGVPKSTIHLYIHTYIREYYNSEYKEIQHLLQFNKRYRCKCRRC